jgi:hypothetical protein
MRNEFDSSTRWTGGDPDATGRHSALLLTDGSRISDERFQSAVIGGLLREAARRVGKSLHLGLHRGVPAA